MILELQLYEKTKGACLKYDVKTFFAIPLTLF